MLAGTQIASCRLPVLECPFSSGFFHGVGVMRTTGGRRLHGIPVEEADPFSGASEAARKPVRQRPVGLFKASTATRSLGVVRRGTPTGHFCNPWPWIMSGCRANLTGTAPGLSKDMAPKANTASPDFEWYVDRTVPQKSWSASQSASASVAVDRFPIKWLRIVQIVNAEFSTIDERLQRLVPCDALRACPENISVGDGKFPAGCSPHQCVVARIGWPVYIIGMPFSCRPADSYDADGVGLPLTTTKHRRLPYDRSTAIRSMRIQDVVTRTQIEKRHHRAARPNYANQHKEDNGTHQSPAPLIPSRARPPAATDDPKDPDHQRSQQKATA